MKLDRALCAACGVKRPLRRNGSFRQHERPDRQESWRLVPCEGSGHPPAVVDRFQLPGDDAARLAAAQKIATALGMKLVRADGEAIA